MKNQDVLKYTLRRQGNAWYFDRILTNQQKYNFID